MENIDNEQHPTRDPEALENGEEQDEVHPDETEAHVRFEELTRDSSTVMSTESALSEGTPLRREGIIQGKDAEEDPNRGSVTPSAQSRSSSLELRKSPVSLLLMPDAEFKELQELENEKQDTKERVGIVRMTCLNPKFDLRTQLMLAFDSLNFVTIFLVVLICVIVSQQTGNNIKEISSVTFSNLAERIHGRTARYLAESLEHRIIPRDAVEIMYQVTRDRFQGYPTFLDDSQVPFRNMVNNENVYPIVGTPLPLDWEMSSLVTAETSEEHVQGRWGWYDGHPFSTANAFFVMQGACNPSETDPMARTYWPNCTDANNDISTGGIMKPSNLTQFIYEKASDLVPTMKALYEYNQDVREIGVYFANQGVGASISFPHYELDSQNTYTATGCDWMKEPNPYDPSRSIGTQEEIDKCYEEGTLLSSREYSPLGRAWCRDQALHPEKVLVDGPFLDAWIDSNWLLSSGRAVYDRITKEFVACIFVGMSTSFVDDIVRESRVTRNSAVSVVRWDPKGTVVASSAWNFADGRETVTIANLRLGMTNETYNDLYSLVNYKEKWDPIQVQQAYESFSSKADGFVVSAYPIPPVPSEFDSSYRPIFLAMSSADESDVFGKVDEVNEDVDDRVNNAIWFSVIVGTAGFVLATIIIILTATAITRPLQRMNKKAELIVGNFDDDNLDEHAIKPIATKSPRCVPKTEITDVVNEFNKMTVSFSGSLMARSEGGKYVEVRNVFDMRDDFMSLYAKRKETGIPFEVPEQKASSSLDESGLPSAEKGGASVNKGSSNGSGDVSEMLTSPFQFRHAGTNLKVRKPILRQTFSSSDILARSEKRPSPLFMWIVLLIVTPLLLTTITISAVVISEMSNEFDESVKDVESHFLDVEVKALSVYVGLRASFVSTYTSRSVRDLYLMTRVASWLLFDGLSRADTFTESVTAVNECLDAKSSETCPWTIENRVCDCAWNYDGVECESYSEVDSRNLQFPYFFVSSDAALPNGTRFKTAFPDNSVSPQTTLWWDGPFDLPGNAANETASGYSTTYDRLQVISAFPLFPVLSNYDAQKENAMGHFIAFEEDGLFFAYEGCFNSAHSFAAFWQSTVENGAEHLRPQLCPLDKYGFDPRCREWYDTGRRRALQEGDFLYITAPYEFAEGKTIAQSATSPLIDPRTGSYVGQTSLDFSVTDIFNVLTSSTPLAPGGFPLLITPTADTYGGDTVIGPGLNGSVASQSVSQVVIPLDQDCRGVERCSYNSLRFDTIVASMKTGQSSTVMFERTIADGNTETVYMAFAPINVQYLDPENVSDFSRGASVKNHLIYSLGLAESKQGMLEPFSDTQAEMQRQINTAIAIVAAVIVVAVVAAVAISYLVARSISEPMAYLLELIRMLNRDDTKQDPPVVDQNKGSKEIVNVSNTMESLYRVVRLANLSFYLGDLEAAYRVLVDALRLFKRLDNKKAIGVACNNLGNAMLAMYREMQIEKVDSKFGLTRKDIIAKGTAYFHEAIQVGEKAYDDFFEVEGWSPNCLDFMQHLSNRYFNRAVFLLTVKKDHDQPEEIESLGFRDLDIARDMDGEIESQGEESGWGSLNRSEKLFNVHLVRIRGYLLLLELGYSDVWEIDESLRDLYAMLSSESKKESSDLFLEMNQVGRLQQAETETMRHFLIKKDIVTAATVAIRMMMEDELILFDSMVKAVRVLFAYVGCNGNSFDEATRSRLEEDLEDIMDDLRDYYDSRRHSAASTRTHTIASKSLRNIGSSSLKTRRTSTLSDQSGQFGTMEQF